MRNLLCHSAAGWRTSVLGHLGIAGARQSHSHGCNLGRERFSPRNAQEAAVTNDSADEAARDVAAADVGREDAVRDEVHHRTDVIPDNF